MNSPTRQASIPLAATAFRNAIDYMNNRLEYFRFNKIYVIESLFENETKTGSNIFNDLLRWKSEQINGLEVQLIILNDKQTFFTCLQEIKHEVLYKHKLPILHFEMHGSDSKNGLILNSHQLITWIELADLLREINVLTKNNLLVSLATCYGAYIFNQIKLLERSPFWGYVAPLEEVTSADIEASFYSFFETLLTTFNFDKSIEILNNSNDLPFRYHFYNSEGVFEMVYNKYEEVNYQPDKYEERLIELTEKVKAFEDVRKKMTDADIKSFLNYELTTNRIEIKNKFRNYFLMLE